MSGYLIAAIRIRHRDIADLAAGGNEAIEVWVPELDHKDSVPGRPVLRHATLEVLADHPTYAYDEDAERLDRDNELGRRLTCRIECGGNDEEIVHLYTTKKARKAAAFGQGVKKVNSLYLEIATPAISPLAAGYDFYRTAGASGAVVSVLCFVAGEGALDVRDEVMLALESHFEEKLGKYVHIDSYTGSDVGVAASFDAEGKSHTFEGTLGEIAPVFALNLRDAEHFEIVAKAPRDDLGVTVEDLLDHTR